jgi:hypothetical protein
MYIFSTCSITYSKYYTPSEHLVLDKIIALFKGSVIFKPITKKQKRSGKTTDMTATHGTVK